MPVLSLVDRDGAAAQSFVDHLHRLRGAFEAMDISPGTPQIMLDAETFRRLQIHLTARLGILNYADDRDDRGPVIEIAGFKIRRAG